MRKLFDKSPMVSGVGRSLWLPATQYPIGSKVSLSITLRAFESSTYDGLRLTRKITNLLLWSPIYSDTMYRGMSKQESYDKNNQRLLGLIGRNPMAFKLVGEAKNHIMTQHQRGDIQGISWSKSLSTAKGFRSSGIKGEILIGCLDNIPETEKYEQFYDSSKLLLSSSGEEASYRHEKEWTVSAAHISSIAARMHKKTFFSWVVESNPFYVDQKALSSDLKVEYGKYLADFYALVHNKEPRRNDLKLYIERTREFYEKVMKDCSYTKEHCHEIYRFLDEHQMAHTLESSTNGRNHHKF